MKDKYRVVAVAEPVESRRNYIKEKYDLPEEMCFHDYKDLLALGKIADVAIISTIYIAVTAIMAWGPGDAAAAIVGKNWGKHKLSGPHIEGIKSVEVSVAMGITSFLCTAATLLIFSQLQYAAG